MLIKDKVYSYLTTYFKIWIIANLQFTVEDINYILICFQFVKHGKLESRMYIFTKTTYYIIDENISQVPYSI